MESFDEISFSSNLNMSIISKSEEIKGENIFFFISCFHNLILDDKSCFFNSQKNNLSEISMEYFEDSNTNKNYKYRVHCIHFIENKKDKYVYLLLNYENLKNMELTKLYIKYQKRFIFSDIKLEEIFLPNFLSLLNNNFTKNTLIFNILYNFKFQI